MPNYYNNAGVERPAPPTMAVSDDELPELTPSGLEQPEQASELEAGLAVCVYVIFFVSVVRILLSSSRISYMGARGGSVDFTHVIEHARSDDAYTCQA